MSREDEVPLQEMHDGLPETAPRSKKFEAVSAPKRMGMVGVLAVVAGTAVFFNAEEQAVEAKIWDREMSAVSNATALPDQQRRRFVVANGLTWDSANKRCDQLGDGRLGICPVSQVCRAETAKQDKKSKLATGQKMSRLTSMLCAGHTGFKNNAGKSRAPIVCRKDEEQGLLTRWLPVVDGTSPVWVNIKTCDVKTASPEEQLPGVVACCSRGKNIANSNVWNSGLNPFVAAHPPAVIQAAATQVKKQKMPGKDQDTTGWSKHEYIDKMRNSDPFLAHKQQGTKMKAMHDHVAEKAEEHLGKDTVASVTSGLADLHGKIKTHIGSVVGALSVGSNTTSIGKVSGALRTSDPSSATNFSPMRQVAQGFVNRYGSNQTSLFGAAVSKAAQITKQIKSNVATSAAASMMFQKNSISDAKTAGSVGGDGARGTAGKSSLIGQSGRTAAYGKAFGAGDGLRVWNGKEGKGPGGSVETRRPMRPGN